MKRIIDHAYLRISLPAPIGTSFLILQPIVHFFGVLAIFFQIVGACSAIFVIVSACDTAPKKKMPLYVIWTFCMVAVAVPLCAVVAVVCRCVPLCAVVCR